QQTHDLEDGLPLAEEAAIEELEISRLVRAAGRAGRDPAVRRASLIRGMIAILSIDLVEASRERIERWLEENGIRDPDAFYARGAPPRGAGFFSWARGRPLSGELRESVSRHIIHSFPVSRHDGHARRVTSAIFRAYVENPRLLPDQVLRAFHEQTGVRFLRE